MKVKKSFVKNYFDNKSGKSLLSTITPDFSEGNANYHLSLIKVPDKPCKVFEIGCGIGRLLLPLAKKGYLCYGCDASNSMFDNALSHENLFISTCDGEGGIPFEELCDFGFSIIVFQHIPNTETVKKYLSSAYNLLKDDGTFVFQLLSKGLSKDAELWTYHDPEELKTHLLKIGFNDVTIDQSQVKWIIITCKKTPQGL